MVYVLNWGGGFGGGGEWGVVGGDLRCKRLYSMSFSKDVERMHGEMMGMGRVEDWR